MVDSPKISLRIPEKILEAAKARCDKTGAPLSQLLLTGLCNEIAQGDDKLLKTLLAEIRAEGRPRKSGE